MGSAIRRPLSGPNYAVSWVSQVLCYRSNSCCLRTSIIPVDTFFTDSLCNDRNALAVDLRFINFKLFGQSVFLSVTLGSKCLACINVFIGVSTCGNL